MAEGIVCGGFLLWYSVQDLRNKEITITSLFLAGIPAAGYAIGEIVFMKDLSATELLGGCIPGVFLLLLGVLSDWKIGAADGIIVTLLGLVIGFWNGVQVLLAAQIPAAIYGLYLLVIRKSGKDASFAFVPFLAVGYLLFKVEEACGIG